MSIRGVWQLSKLSIVHCRSQGSSRGAREFVLSTLPHFKAVNPHIEVQTVHRNNRHPYVLAHYGQLPITHSQKTTTTHMRHAEHEID